MLREAEGEEPEGGTSVKRSLSIKEKGSGGDALRGNTRTHPEHESEDLSGR